MSKYEIAQTYEELDLLRCETTSFAERHCRKLRTGQVAFSPELNLCRLKIIALSLLISKAKKRKVSSRLISRTLKKANLPANFKSYPVEKLQRLIKEAYTAYYQIKGEATQLRASALENLAEALAQKGDSTKEKMLKALREREAQRDTARKIRYLQGKLRTGSTTMVTTVDNDGNRIDITDKAEIEKAILDST